MIVPFEPWHLERYRPVGIDGIGYDADQLKTVAERINGLSVIQGREVLGIGMWHVMDNVAVVSVFLSDALRACPIFLTKATKAGMAWFKHNGVKTLKASSATQAGDRWLEFLGFNPTGETKTINGVTATVYKKEM